MAMASHKVKPTEIVHPFQCKMVTMPNDYTNAGHKVARLVYTNSGTGLLALGTNGILKLWRWPRRSEQDPSCEANASQVPIHWQPDRGVLMTNDVSGINFQKAYPCLALSNNDCYVLSAAGGNVSLFNTFSFKVMTTFMPPPPAVTFIAFHPQDNNIIVIGMEDSTIRIYNIRVDEVKSTLKGHRKRLTGLAFSTSLNIFVSSCANAQLCVWSLDSWEKIKTVPIQLPARKSSPNGDTRVQFHSDAVRLLVSHESQLAIYDASEMERIHQWVPQDSLSAPISYADYSCNNLLVFSSFYDGNIGVFDADTLGLRCRIAPTAYLWQNGNLGVHPLVITAHPQCPNQFAVGLSDGSVKVLEPPESEGKWGVGEPVDKGAGNSRAGLSATTSNAVQFSKMSIQ